MNKPKKVRNPLRKRLFRELLHDFGKYVVIFTFIFATIAMVAGFLVSDISLKTAYDESFEEYNVEDGHFTLLMPAEDGFFDGMERYYKVKVYENFYADREAADGDAVRVYRLRKDVNRTALWEGDYPSGMGEIAIDRLYAENNGYSVGDTMIIETSDASHDIANDFNYDFFSVGNTFGDSRNDITASIACTVSLGYEAIVKDTI